MKNLLIICFFLGLFLSTGTAVNAQLDQAQNESKFKHSLGAGAGFTTGYGLSYRFMPKKFGAQVNFAPYKDANSERYSVGLTFLYNLIETRYVDFFAYQGNHFYSNSYDVFEYDPNPPYGSTTRREKESYVNNGLGLGVEFIIAKRIGLNLMGGYAFYDNFSQINFTGETALYFKF